MSGAVSCTGHGESILKVTLARLILSHVEQGNAVTLETSSRQNSSDSIWSRSNLMSACFLTVHTMWMSYELSVVLANQKLLN